MQFNYRYDVRTYLRVGSRHISDPTPKEDFSSCSLLARTKNLKASELTKHFDDLQLHGVTGVRGSIMTVVIEDVTNYDQPGACGECDECNANTRCSKLQQPSFDEITSFIGDTLTRQLDAERELCATQRNSLNFGDHADLKKLEDNTQHALEWLRKLIDDNES